MEDCLSPSFGVVAFVCDVAEHGGVCGGDEEASFVDRFEEFCCGVDKEAGAYDGADVVDVFGDDGGVGVAVE